MIPVSWATAKLCPAHVTDAVLNDSSTWVSGCPFPILFDSPHGFLVFQRAELVIGRVGVGWDGGALKDAKA